MHILTYQFKQTIIFVSQQSKDEKKSHENPCRSSQEISCLQEKELMEGGIDWLVG